VVDYDAKHSHWYTDGIEQFNTRTTPLSVEGTFDEVLLGAGASLEARRLFPDIKMRAPQAMPR